MATYIVTDIVLVTITLASALASASAVYTAYTRPCTGHEHGRVYDPCKGPFTACTDRVDGRT